MGVVKTMHVIYYTVGWFGPTDTKPMSVSETDFLACVDDGGVISYESKFDSGLGGMVANITATISHDT